MSCDERSCARRHYGENVDHYRRKSKEYYENGGRATQRRYYEANHDRLRADYKRYYRDNIERIRAYDEANRDRNNASKRRHYEANKDAYIEKANNRRMLELNRMPAWADRKAISAVYREARRLTRETGIPHHVDHRVPLFARDRETGEVVASGLHVHWNRQIVTAEVNLSKWCYLPDDG